MERWATLLSMVVELSGLSHLVNQVPVNFANRGGQTGADWAIGRARADIAWPGFEIPAPGTPLKSAHFRAFVCIPVRLKASGPVAEQRWGGSGLMRKRHTATKVERRYRASQGAGVTGISKCDSLDFAIVLGIAGRVFRFSMTLRGRVRAGRPATVCKGC